MQEDNKSEKDTIVRENEQGEEDLKENIELLPPNNTIYINNLNEKIHIDGFFKKKTDFILKILHF